MTEAASATLHFDPASHTYTRTDTGEVIPSVTRIIAPLTSYFRVPLDRLRLAADRGTAVHSLTEAYDRGQTTLWEADEALAGYLEAWIAFRYATGFEAEAIEERVYHDRYGYAGTIDRVGYLFGNLAVLDIKTGKHLGPAVGVQLAGYQCAANHQYPCRPEVTHRYAVQLADDGTYQIHEYASLHDLAAFLGCLALWEWAQVTNNTEEIRLTRTREGAH